MEPALSTPFPLPLVCLTGPLSGNSRHGVTSRNPALNPGQFVSNSRTTIGLRFPCSGTASGLVVAPSKGPRSGYESLFCLGDALQANGLSLALDAVGLIPEAEGFIKAFENTAGYQIARAVGNNAGYRGVVATQYGMMAVAQAKGGVSMINGALGLGDTSVKGRISTAATVAGFIPGLGTYAAGVSIGVDASKTYDAQSACVNSGKYD
jgi:hypothetical protein